MTQGFKNPPPERTLLVGVRLTQASMRRRAQHIGSTEEHLDELERLAESAGALVIDRCIQDRPKPDPRTFVGKGFVQELARIIEERDIDLVCFDDELSPTQNRNLETDLDCKVLDRTGLILDIFARRARTKEGKLQVSLAQMEYLYPRLVGRWMHFSRQEGGIGMRGPGETQLEVDRRLVKKRIAHLTAAIEKIKSERELRRENRESMTRPVVALVGYTNAGKSSLLNALAGTHEYTDDLLFATLDPIARRVKLTQNLSVLLIDTVGLVQKLPHQLVAAFRSTFEEIQQADLLLHVVDASHPQNDLQISEVQRVLAEYKVDLLPCLMVYNKADLLKGYPVTVDKISFYVSATQDIGLDALRAGIVSALENQWPEVNLRLPASKGRLRAQLFEHGAVLKETLDGAFLEMRARVPVNLLSTLDEYLVKNTVVGKRAKR